MIKKLNPDIKIRPKGVAYIPTETLVKRRLARISKSDAEAEHQRLRDAVVEAAKKYRAAVLEHLEYAKECLAGDAARDEEDDTKWDAQLGAQCSTEYALSEAVDALNKFEAER